MQVSFTFRKSQIVAAEGGREGLEGISGGAMGMKSKGSFNSCSLVRLAE